MEQYETVEAFVEVLNAHNVDCIFFNPGADNKFLVNTIPKLREAGKCTPRMIMCLDESEAMSAAHGHYMVSGLPQVVVVHSELGTLQIGGAIHNACWDRIPIILWAGVQKADQRVNWMKEPYEQRRIVRDFVKWDHELGKDENFHDVLQKAFKIAFTEPCGPVYLTYPSELLENNKINKVRIPPVDKVAVSAAPSPDLGALDRAAEILINANNPLIVAGTVGRHHQSVALLVKLAETMCAPVLTGQQYMNFPTTHPLFVGTEQIRGSRKATPYITEADVILAIDYDMPYFPAEGLPKPDAKFIHIGLDPLTVGRRLWGRGADIFIEADSREAIPALNEILRKKITTEQSKRLNTRFRQLEKAHKKMLSDWHTLAMSRSEQKPISPEWLCHCIDEIIDEDTIVVNNTISHSASVTEQIHRTKPGTMFGCYGSSFNWVLPAALGVKLGAPEKTVVCLVPDGGFIWGCPTATLWAAKNYNAPFLTVIFNNQAYMDYTDWDIPSPPDYELTAQACGAYGQRVEDPADVLTALKSAIDQVRGGKAAVVNVWLPRRASDVSP